MKNIFVLIISVMLFTACEKEIDIDLNSSESQVVIDGSITDAPGPYYVRITQSVNFSESNSYPAVTGALVVISDNHNNIDTLSEVSDGLYETHTVTGVPGNTYYLTINIDEKEYTATSTMPHKVNFDALEFEESSGPDGDFTALPIYKDPETPDNRYRFLLTVNGEVDESYYVFNDNLNNGTVNERSIFSPDMEIEEGDSVTVEMRCVDMATYTYFYTLSQFSGGGPIGGTTPTNPPNNIGGDPALGIFAAYTIQTKTEQASY